MHACINSLLVMFVSTEIEDLFSELFFGINGGWIGFIILASIMLLVTAKVNYAGILFMVVSVFMGVMMSGELAANNTLWWCCIMYFTMPFFLFLVMIKGNRGSL